MSNTIKRRISRLESIAGPAIDGEAVAAANALVSAHIKKSDGCPMTAEEVELLEVCRPGDINRAIAVVFKAGPRSTSKDLDEIAARVFARKKEALS